MDFIMQYALPVAIGLIIGFLLLSWQKNKKVNVTMLDPETFKKNMRKGQLIDIRKQERFNENKIKGARNFRVGYLKSKTQTKVRKDKPVYLYCDNGRKSASAAKKLYHKGYQEIYVLNGGLQNYNKEITA